MELDLKEFSQTLAIGAMFVCGVLAIVRLFLSDASSFLEEGHNTRDPRKSGAVKKGPVKKGPVKKGPAKKGTATKDAAKKDAATKGEVVLSAVLLTATVFATGIMAEDFSKSVVGQGPPSALKQIWLLNSLLPRDSELRLDALFDGDGKQRQLLKQIANAHLLQLTSQPSDSDNAIALQTRLCGGANRSCLKGDKLLEENNPLDLLYYHAKPLLYQKEHFYDELSHIESRANFSRALAFTCFTLFALYILAWSLRKGAQRFAPQFVQRRLAVHKAILIPLLLIIGYVGSRYAFEAEQYNFYRRVYGYYFSLRNEDIKPAEQTKNRSSRSGAKESVISSGTAE